MTPLQILITGATGYIGGSFINQLGSFNSSTNANTEYTVLLRSASQASLFTNLNVKSIILNNPEDLNELRQIASKFDVIVNFAYISLPDHAKALVHGLDDRKKANPNTREPVFVQASSGTSNLADRPFTAPTRVADFGLPTEYTDLKPVDVYDTEKKLEANEPYALRTTELAVIDTGVELGVKTHVVMIPTVYGAGTGPGNKLSIQIPLLIRSVLKHGYVAVAGDGHGEWDRVHIRDLVDLLDILLKRVIEGQDVSSGKEGIIFAGAIRNTWRNLAEMIVDVGAKLGKIPNSTQIKHTGFEEAATTWGLGGALGLAELGFSSNSRTTAEKAKEWGWMPKHVEMEEGVKEDWIAITDEK